MNRIIFVFLILFFLPYLFTSAEEFDFKKVKVEQFIDSEICKGCHEEIYEQWNGSMHSGSFTDPLWQAAVKLFCNDINSKDELTELKTCIKCHTPLGFRLNIISKPADDFSKITGLPAQGIFCNWCHAINEVKHLSNAGYEVDTAGGEDNPSVMLGPRNDAVSDFHPAKYSELHTKAEFCALCHNVTHSKNDLIIENTYGEWKSGPYNTGDPATTVLCQDCHMKQKPGFPSTGKTVRPLSPGKSADDGIKRDHIWTHYFIGGNSIIPKISGKETHSKMAVERLQNAADLEIIKHEKYSKNNISEFKVKVINSGCGHYLPTGQTELREAWLEVKVTDSEGKVLLNSGYIDKDGDVEKNAVIFKTVFGDKNGDHVLNIAKADRVLSDHRIPPKGHSLEKYSFYIPENALSPGKIEVKLQYRTISQKLADILLKDKAPRIPVVTMTDIEDKIEW